jgi:mannose-6-phosphate isomerase-like protein (cupin superfamily)
MFVPRFVSVGRDADGRSAVIELRELGPDEQTVTLVSGIELGGELPAPPDSSTARRVDLDGEQPRYPPGVAGWAARWHAPHEAFPMHYTATVDFDVIVAGTTTLVLEAGEVELGPGDCVVIDGVPHAWRAGPEGCRLYTLLIGKAIGGAS